MPDTKIGRRRKGKNPNPIVVEGNHEPIISKELFNQVQKRLEMESKQPEWNNQGSNLLTGLIKCPQSVVDLWRLLTQQID